MINHLSGVLLSHPRGAVQVDKIATLLRGDPKDRTRGPVAFVVNPDRKGFADAFAEVT
jgi:hypothetical protein